MEVPPPLEESALKMHGVGEQPAEGMVMSDADKRAEHHSDTNRPSRLNQSADAVDNGAGTDPARKEESRREATELKPIQDIRESGPGNKSPQSHNSQRVQPNEPHAADLSNQPHPDSLVNSGRQLQGQVQITAHSNTGPEELGEDGRPI